MAWISCCLTSRSVLVWCINHNEPRAFLFQTAFPFLGWLLMLYLGTWPCCLGTPARNYQSASWAVRVCGRGQVGKGCCRLLFWLCLQMRTWLEKFESECLRFTVGVPMVRSLQEGSWLLRTWLFMHADAFRSQKAMVCQSILIHLSIHI